MSTNSLPNPMPSVDTKPTQPPRGSLRIGTTVITAMTASALLLTPTTAHAQSSELSSIWSPSALSSYSSSEALSSNSTSSTSSLFRGRRIPSQPGVVTRTQTIGDGIHRIWYTSTTEVGRVVEVSGVYMEPNPRTTPPADHPAPIVVYAPGTRGQGDSCAASRGPELLGQSNAVVSSVGVNYERPFYSEFTDRGMHLVITDYIGLGTPGMHTYGNRVEQGRAVLDAARAALSLSNSRAWTPVGIFGYSQGGGATAAAAELATTYAPDVNLLATYAGAPPADFQKVITGADFHKLGAVIGFAINGLSARDPDFARAIDRYTTVKGKYWLQETARSCVADAALRWQQLDQTTLTTGNQTLAELLDSDPQLLATLKHNKLGQAAPRGAILIGSERNDDIIPFSQVEALADTYRKYGANPAFLTGTTEHTTTDSLVGSIAPGASVLAGGHVGGMLGQFTPALDWLENQLQHH